LLEEGAEDNFFDLLAQQTNMIELFYFEQLASLRQRYEDLSISDANTTNEHHLGTLYSDCLLLKSYASLNYAGITKILGKYVLAPPHHRL
jgi:hypothetical protein